MLLCMCRCVTETKKQDCHAGGLVFNWLGLIEKIIQNLLTYTLTYSIKEESKLIILAAKISLLASIMTIVSELIKMLRGD